MPASDQKVTADRYTLIPRTLVFLIHENKVLLIQGGPYKRLWANLYNGVGGHIERGEDPLSAARCELLEETGLKSNDLRLVGVVTIDAEPKTGIGIYVFRGTLSSGKLADSTEGKLEWVPYGSLDHLALVEDLPVLLPRVLAASPGAPPFSAQYTYDEQGKMAIKFA